MKKFALAMILALSSSLSFANNLAIKGQCTDIDTLKKYLNKYSEIPFLKMSSIRAKDQIYDTVLFVNPTTGSWTLVEDRGPGNVCVVGIGQDMDLIERKSGKNI